MPIWKPEQNWKDSDVFIIGGGPSLAGFRWERLNSLRTIGCNSAYRLGARLCSICFSSDEDFFLENAPRLLNYSRLGGLVVTSCEAILNSHGHLHWVEAMPRQEHGLCKTPEIFFGYGGSSGSGAIHLALLLGARRIFLLGFDGKLASDGKANWHPHGCENKPEVYKKFEEDFELISRTYQTVFPGTQIINLNRQSALPFFTFGDIGDYLP